MIKKKICLLGYFAVGKTSLVRRFVFETFSDKYLTTIGVKIDKKVITVNNETVQLMIWDIHGEDRFQKVHQSYLMGMSGYLLVIDGTREESLSVINNLRNLAEQTVGKVPFLVLINKTDLTEQQQVTPDHLIKMGIEHDLIISTSAKTGAGVEEAFSLLTKKLL